MIPSGVYIFQQFPPPGGGEDKHAKVNRGQVKEKGQKNKGEGQREGKEREKKKKREKGKGKKRRKGTKNKGEGHREGREVKGKEKKKREKGKRVRVQIPALIRHMYSAFGCIEAWYSPQCTDEVLQEKLQVILDELHSPRSEEYTELLEDIV